MRLLVPVGTFHILSPRLVISDPYDFDRHVLERAVVGEWHAYVERIPTKDWGVRNVTLVAAHACVFGEELDAHWHQTGFKVGNGTGIIGIWGERGFVPHEPDPLGVFVPAFHAACAVRVNDAELRAGVMDGGVVAASGIGDGNYMVEKVESIDGDTVAVLVDFTSDQNDPLGIKFASETTAFRWKGTRT